MTLTKRYKESSKLIKDGNDVDAYLLYCSACGIYKTLMFSCPSGPGGTLSCPVCRERDENGPGIEFSFGSVHTKRIRVTLHLEEGK